MRGEALGPLHGVPAAIKDLFDFKPGWPTTFGGVRALNDIAQFHCPFAEQIEKAGAILVGKTNSPVLGPRGVCDNYLFGATRNPFETSRNPGGHPVEVLLRLPMAFFRWRKEWTLADRCAFRRRGAVIFEMSAPSVVLPQLSGAFARMAIE